MSDDENIAIFPAKHRRPDKGLMLVPPEPNTCSHYPAAFTVDVKAGKCTCRKCGADVAPMFVLEMLMHKESQWNRTREAYQDEMKRLKDRSSTKCQHCQRMTRISGR